MRARLHRLFEVRSTDRRLTGRWIAWGDCIVAWWDRLVVNSPTFLALLALAGCMPAPQLPPEMAANVRVKPVVREEVALEISLVGSILPLEVSRVAAGAEGKVIEFPFREGMQAEKGAVLAKLRDITLSIEIQSSEALAAQRKAIWEEMQAGYRKEEIEQSRARNAAAEEADRLAQSKLARMRDLYKRNAASQEQLDDVQTEAERMRQIYLETKADFELKTAGYRREQVAQAKAAYEAAAHSVRQLQDELLKRTVTAPFAGYVVAKHTDLGEWVEKGGAVVTLTDLSSVEVVVNVDENYIHLLTIGQSVPVQCESLPQHKFTGEVVQIIPKSAWETGSRSFPVRVRLANEVVGGQPLLKEGMLARVTFRGPAHQAILVPKDSVVRSGARPMVYLVSAEKRAVPVPVIEGLSKQAWVEVDAKLAVGDRIVSEGAERLRPNQLVNILEDAAPGGPAAPPKPAGTSATGKTAQQSTSQTAGPPAS